jgi:hypothetical protein
MPRAGDQADAGDSDPQLTATRSADDHDISNDHQAVA